jgi:hypothetical protein
MGGIKLPLKLIILIVLVGLVLSGASYISVDTRNSIAANTMSDLYAQDGIDLVFLGSSTTYESCDPAVFDERLGLNTFNAATPAQTLRDSYYQLKEMLRLYRPKYAVLGISALHLMNRQEQDSLSSDYLFENMRWSGVKAGYLLDAFSPDYWPSALWPAVRLREELTADDIRGAAEGRLQALQGSPQQLKSDQLEYRGKGYVANLEEIQGGVLPQADPLGFTGSGSITPKARDYLDRIVMLCEAEGIELTIFQPPLLPGATAWIGDYAAYHDAVDAYAQEHGLTFIDFNYIDPDIITYEDAMFSDLEHTTVAFAQEFSGTFSDILGTYYTDGAEAIAGSFGTYDDYRARYAVVASVWVTGVSADGVSAASVGVGEPEYYFSVVTDDEAQETVFEREWSASPEAEFPELAPGGYIVTVLARTVGSPEETEKMNGDVFRVE